MVEAIIGALVGAVAGGIVTYIITMRSMTKALQERREETENSRSWEILSQAIPVYADLLNSHTAEDARKNPDLLFELRRKLEWQEKINELYRLSIASDLYKTASRYLEALEHYTAGKLSEGALGELRTEVRNALANEIAYVSAPRFTLDENEAIKGVEREWR